MADLMRDVGQADAPFHGGPDAQGAATHDFSTNANACGPCPAASAALRRADAARYPDPHYAALCEDLARLHGVDAARIVVAASASEFIGRITAAVAQRGGRRVWLPPHSYGDYRRAGSAWALEAAPADAADLAWCCDPSSPLGQSQPGLPALVDALPAEAVGVIDLAYEPLRLEGSLGLDASRRSRLWQVWSPNKALGLTGVRAAYAIAPADADAQARQVRALAPSWPIGAHGVAMLHAWCGADAQAWLAASLDGLRRWKMEQQAMCAALGWACQPSVANFFCARPDVPYAVRSQALRVAGIKLRDTGSFGLPGQVRLGVLPPASQSALRAAWRDGDGR